MKIECEYEVTRKEKVVFEADDRVYDEDTKVWKIANIILEKRLENLRHDMYSDNVSVVEYNIGKINEAFIMADEILEL
jgi:hypothetical protein